MPNDIKIATATALFAVALVILRWKPKPLAERIPFIQRIPNLKEIRKEILEDNRRTAGLASELHRMAQMAFSPVSRRQPLRPLPRLFRDPSELKPHEKLPNAAERAALLSELADPCDKCGLVDCVAYKCQDPVTIIGKVVKIASTPVAENAPAPIRVLTGIWDDYQPDMAAVTRIQSAYAKLEAAYPAYSD